MSIGHNNKEYKMKNLKTLVKGNIGTELTQLGPTSFRVSQCYLGSTPSQLGINFYKNLNDASLSFNNLTK